MSRKYRLAHLVLRSDQAGSFAYVAVALVLVPVVTLISPLREIMWLVGLVLGISGLALGLLGILVAWGLSVEMARGKELPDHLLKAMGLRVLPKS